MSIRGFADLNKDEGKTKKSKETYAGGHSSGLAIQGRDPLEKIVNRAKE